MHCTFEIFPKNPSKVNRIICNESPTFTQKFPQLFPSNGEYTESMQSYLKLLHKFEISGDLSEYETSHSVVKRLYQKFQILENHDGVYKFWVYLVEMYGKIGTATKERPNFDNIFGFMNGFPVENTKVVIIGRDPAEKRESSGYAYHGSFCVSTRILFDNFVDHDLKLVNKVCKTCVSTMERDRALLGGWIEQGVLLLNTFLTYYLPKYEWLDFTKFLVKELSSSRDCLVFILTCADARHHLEELIDKEKHAVFNVHHPANPEQNLSSEYRWDVQLPYLNANYYFHQKQKNNMIDWVYVVEKLGNVELAKYTKCFEIVEEGNSSQFVSREEITTGNNRYFVLRKNMDVENQPTSWMPWPQYFY